MRHAIPHPTLLSTHTPLLRARSRLAEDRDGFVLYSVVVLTQFRDVFTAAAKQQRFVVRDFDARASTASDSKVESEADKLARLETEDARARRQISAWCRSHYSEAAQAWIHIKVLRVWVDAVLRYSLPVNFACVIIKPVKKHERKLRQALSDAYASASVGGVFARDDKKMSAAAVAAAAAAGVSDKEFYPYVSVTVESVGAVKDS